MTESLSRPIPISQACGLFFFGAFVPFVLVGILLHFGFISFPQGQSYAVVDTQTILRQQAEVLAQSSKDKEIQEEKVTEFIHHMDEVMGKLATEKNLILLQPQAVAQFQVPDMTDEVSRRLGLSQGEHHARAR